MPSNILALLTTLLPSEVYHVQELSQSFRILSRVVLPSGSMRVCWLVRTDHTGQDSFSIATLKLYLKDKLWSFGSPLKDWLRLGRVHFIYSSYVTCCSSFLSWCLSSTWYFNPSCLTRLIQFTHDTCSFFDNQQWYGFYVYEGNLSSWPSVELARIVTLDWNA